MCVCVCVSCWLVGKIQEMEAMVVGNDIGNLESMRWALRSPFDRNLVTHYDTQVSECSV